MIRQSFRILHYWKVIVYYNINYDFYCHITNDYNSIGIAKSMQDEIKATMSKGLAKGVTVSSFKHRTSIVCFNIHKSKSDFINTIVHESKHIQSAICSYYNVPEDSEDAARTIGYVIEKMYSVFKKYF